MRNNAVRSVLKLLLPPVLVIAVLVGFSAAVADLSRGRSAEDLKQLETALRRAAVACYAAEGVYPQDLQYLKDNYGLQIDERRYYVDYQVFGSNIMPDITVLELKP